MNIIKKLIIGCVFIVLLICTFINVYNKYHTNSSINESILNKTIEFPDSLEKVNFDGKDSLVCLDNINNKKYKLLSLFNPGCGKCILSLNNVGKHFKTFEKNGEFTCFHLGKNMATDIFMLKYVANELDINLSFPVYFDTNKIFFKLNKMLSSIPDSQLLLLDENNKILFVNNFQEIDIFFNNINNYLNHDF